MTSSIGIRGMYEEHHVRDRAGATHFRPLSAFKRMWHIHTHGYKIDVFDFTIEPIHLFISPFICILTRQSMFYPAARTYGAPTTGRRKLTVHNENDLTTFGPTGGGLPSKTPSRAGGSKSQQLLPGTVGRVGLGAKTEGRDRNVLKGQQGVEGNGKGTGKGKDEEIGKSYKEGVYEMG